MTETEEISISNVSIMTDIIEAAGTVHVGEHVVVTSNEKPNAGASIKLATRVTDAGYAWVILAAASASHVAFGFLLYSFSVLYSEIVEHFKSSLASAGWIGSLSVACFGLLALCQGFVVDKIGARLSCIVGGLLTSLGLVLSSFLVSVPYLWFTYGFLTGVSSGLFMLASITVVQRHFVSKLPMANGIRTSCANLGGLVSGPLMRYLIDEYGLRGAILLEAGIVLQTVVCGSLYRPVETQAPTEGSPEEKTYLSRKECATGEEEQPTSVEEPSKHICCSTGVFRREIFKNTRLLLYLAASFMQCAGITIFYIHIVNYALWRGFTKNQSALLPFALNVGICTGALSFGFLANLQGYNKMLQMTCVITVKGLVVVSTIFISSYPLLMFVVGISGFLGGSIFAVEVTNLSELVPIDLIVTAQSLLLTMFGTSSLLSVTFAGFLADLTGTYTPAMCMSGALQSVAAVFYGSIVCINRLTSKIDRRPKMNDIFPISQFAETAT